MTKSKKKRNAIDVKKATDRKRSAEKDLKARVLGSDERIGLHEQKILGEVTPTAAKKGNSTRL